MKKQKTLSRMLKYNPPKAVYSDKLFWIRLLIASVITILFIGVVIGLIIV